ncbi:MAG: SAM-dependent methyltransferase [Deltaproteobacteria bacterium]|nr:SAM-dependent methyltransferase [Deltaproteobacteria bacterium]
MVEWNPGRLLELSGGYWASCTLHAAVKLDLFSLIEAGHTTSSQLAHELGLNARGTATLLNALVAMDLLTKDQAQYANTEAARSFLVRGSPEYIGYMILHHHHLVRAWSRLDQAVRSGKPVRERVASEHEERESFLMGMFNNAMAIAPRLADEIDVKGRRRLLDLGGGPGTYAIHFCLTNPGLEARVADLPASRPFAEKTIARFGVSDRVQFIPCDYLHEDIQGQYDVAWLSHILHGEGPDACRMIINKAVSSLEPGGMMMIHDFILKDTADGPLFPALFSLNMLVNTMEGRSYTESQIRDMMRQAGLKNITRFPFRGPTDSGILMGERYPSTTSSR